MSQTAPKIRLTKSQGRFAADIRKAIEDYTLSNGEASIRPDEMALVLQRIVVEYLAKAVSDRTSLVKAVAAIRKSS